MWTTTSVVCGETESDVKRRYDYFVHETGDWAAAEKSTRDVLAGGSKTVDVQVSKETVESRIAGAFGPGLIGTPEQIVEKMQAFVDAGIDGRDLVRLREGRRDVR